MRHLPGYFSRPRQEELRDAILAVIEAAPLYTPVMPRTGKRFSVAMTNCGSLGWVSDRDRGYHYLKTHPHTLRAWPPMPESLRALWRDVTDYRAAPEACLVNYYAPGARMGLHRDEDEADFSAPVVSVSLGDTARFRIGGKTRRGPTRSFELASGDVLVLEGDSRLAYHGVDRVLPGTSDLFRGGCPGGGRINLTLRRVTKP